MSVAKPYDSTSGFSAWRLRKLVVDFGVYMALAILLLAAFFLTPKLYQVDTIAVVMRQASQLGIVAIGQTMILLVAGLDLLGRRNVIVMTSVAGGGSKQRAQRDGCCRRYPDLRLALGALIGMPATACL